MRIKLFGNFIPNLSFPYFNNLLNLYTLPLPSVERTLDYIQYDFSENTVSASAGGFGKIHIMGFPFPEAVCSRTESGRRIIFSPVVSVGREIMLCTPLSCSAVRPFSYYVADAEAESNSQYPIPFTLKNGVLDFFTDSRFFGYIPPDVRKVISEFGNSNWGLLKCSAENPFFCEFAVSSPAAAFIIANINVFTRGISLSRSDIDSLMKDKQVKTLELAGFPPQEKFRKALQKIPAGELSVYGLLSLRRCLKKESLEKRRLKLLSHIKSLPEEAVYIISSSELLGSVADKFVLNLGEIQDKQKRKKIMTMLAGVRGLYRTFWAKLPKVRDESHIGMLQEKIENRYGIKKISSKYYSEFRKSPFPDAPFIRQLAAPVDMIVWGGYMRNCLRGRISDAIKGNIFYYKVKLGAETATVQVTASRSGYVLSSILGRFNRGCSTYLTDMVWYWFENKGLIDCRYLSN